MAAEDREDLALFLDELRELLKEAVYERRWLPRDVRAEVEEAFGPVRSRIDDLIDDLRATAESPELDSALEAVGLTGTQRKAKLSGFRRAVVAFGRFPVRSAFLAALKWGNVIVGSLGKVLPQAEVVKEFKEMIEAALSSPGRLRLRAERVWSWLLRR